MNLSVTDPIGRAWAYMVHVLFRPFSLGKWFVLGFVAWLASLGEGGGNLNIPSGNTGGGSAGNEGFEGIGRAIENNLGLVIGITIAVVAVVIAIGLLVLWLQSRARFMFCHDVAHNTTDIRLPWRRYREQGNSLFWFSILFALAAVVAMLAIAGSAVALAWPDIQAEQFGWSAGLAIAHGSASILTAILLISVIALLVEDFIVPVMYLRQVRIADGWRIFRDELVGGAAGAIALYLLMRWLLSMAAGLAAMAITLTLALVTCCLFVLAAVLSLGYIGVVAMLPIPVFFRAYSLYFLEQFGGDWRLIPHAPPAIQTPSRPNVKPTIPLD